MARLGVESDIAELAIDHKRKGLERLYNFDQAWKLRCEAFAKASDYIAGLLYRAAAEGRVVAIPGRAASTAPSGAQRIRRGDQRVPFASAAGAGAGE
jgi:hypothetical protein